MPEFRTQYDFPFQYFSPAGSRTKVLYGPIFDSNGRMSLKETGVHDLYAEIQSHADSVDIHVLLRRFAQGDPGALARVQGAYGDFTQVPKTFAEALNTLIAAEQYFNGLPVDVRAQFGHDFHQFIASMDAPDWLTKAGLVPKPDDVVPSQPVTPSAPSVPSPVSETPVPSTNPSSSAPPTA